MDTNIVDMILNSGGVFGLAIFAIWMLNRVWQLRMEERERYADSTRQMWDATYRALENNTNALRALAEKIEGKQQ